MDELFTLYVHHGGYFDVNPQKYVGGEVGVIDDCDPDKWYKKYVGGEVGVVDDCDPDKWSKVEIESICREFGYTHVTRLWNRSLEDNEEDGVFQLIKDDHDAMAMTKLVRGHGQIHVYVEHPVYKPILINDGNGVPVDIVVGPDHDGPFVVSDSESCSFSELERSCDRNDDSDDEVEILECKRPGKEPIVEEPIVEGPQQDGAVTTDSNDSFEDSDVEGARSMNPNQRYVGENSASSDSEDLTCVR
nr:hypothetical protein CFP56_66002 [Quercus suber]